ncbi:uncharacterized protein LOC143290762 [Babylonia areolata]|uniref:uncharacterized protein LOC143290762 n=1 Tax=Babylonia areolata TaxID=304850 RepID=UPI003FD30412
MAGGHTGLLPEDNSGTSSPEDETTWQERAQRSAQAIPVATQSDSAVSNGERPPVSELSQLRLKLEEKRREIERKKQQQEVQSAKMRQRLGKAAFMRVISKKEESGNSIGTLSGHPALSAWTRSRRMEDATKSSPSLNQRVLQDKLDQLDSEEPTHPTTLNTSSSSSNSTSASQSPSISGRSFSREGIRQTFDGVRRRWFHGSDPEGELIYSTDQTNDAEGVSQLGFDMMQSCPPCMASSLFGYSSYGLEEGTVDQEQDKLKSSVLSYSPPRESSQSPHRTPEKRVLCQHRSRGNSKLVQNVSMSWDTADSAALVLVSSADLNDLETAAVSSVPRTSITCQEQLLPAQLRLSKEKGNQQSKADELGDQSHKQRMVAESRLMKGKVSMPKTAVNRRPGSGGAGMAGGHTGLLPEDNSGTSSPEDGNVVSRHSDTPALSLLSPQKVGQQGAPGSQPLAIPEGSSRASGVMVEGDTHHASHPAFSHQIGDLSSDSDWAAKQITSREGSIASSRSSGDFSDHESHKIHQDHKGRESQKQSSQATEPHRLQAPSWTLGPPHSQPEEWSWQGKHTVNRLQKGSEEQRNMDFAESQQQMEAGSIRSAFQRRSNSGSKKTTFAPIPTETTWQERAQRSAQAIPVATQSDSAVSNGERPPVSELSQLRLKLEEKRREIERKKQQQEVQSAKMRQRLGKAAFMRVISKKEESGNSIGTLSGHPALSAWTRSRRMEDATKSSPSLNQRVLQDKLDQLDSEEPTHPTTLNTSSSSSNSTSASQSPSISGRSFSREGIQQTIDGVRRRWFHGSDPEGELIYSTDQTNDAEGVSQLGFDMMQSCPPCMASSLFGYSSYGLEEGTVDQEQDKLKSSVLSYSPPRESSQSPRRTPEKRVSWAENKKQKDYDESLDKLNRSLTDLQGEIKRLTLQQKDVFSPIHLSEEPPGFSVSVQQDPSQPSPISASPQCAKGQSQHLSSAPMLQKAFPAHDPRTADSLPHSSSPLIPRSPQLQRHSDSLEEDSLADGFFVSFGEDTPRRPKPQLSTSGVKKDVESDSHQEGSEGVSQLQGKLAATVVVDSDSGSSSSDSYHSLPGGLAEEGSHVDVDNTVQPMSVKESDMKQKRERLMQQQLKRQEELEQKRLQKEMESQRRQQEKIVKEEEQEKKKAEEKARREAIFQQYIQKKLEQDEDKSLSPSTVSRRDRSSNRRDHSVNRRNHSSRRQPRPKSMFAKARPMPADLDDVMSRGLSSHSSQEDLSSHSSPMGSTVSCDQLNQNEEQGSSASRQPPSPGTKLYVKPSAKSNRHIIINALSYCCLAGSVNTDLKNKVLEEIARSTAKHFLILFRDHGCQYRGLFSFDPDTEEACKIMGVGPRQLCSEMVERFYKYNSGGKSFNEVTSTKHLSVSIDAVVLKNVYWKTKVTSATKR